MRCPAYSSYKSSDIQWVGDIPDGWSTTKLRYLALLKSGENITSDELEDGGEFPVFGGNGIRGYSSRFTHVGNYVLIGRQGALCGNINYADGHFWASEHAIVISPLVQFPTFWLGELLRVMNLNQYSISAAQPGLAVQMIGGLKIPVPPFPDQVAIARFLEVQTGKIDHLVAKKQELIERLREKRSALISRTIIRGLPPIAARAAELPENPPLKPSSVDWLGDVPAHWEVKRLKFALSKVEQGWSPQCDNAPAGEGEWGVLKAGAVNGSEFDPRENKRLPDDEIPLRELEIKTGDFLISRANTRELVGSAALVKQVQPRLLLCDKLYRLTIRTNTMNPEFLLRFMRSEPGHYEFERDASGSSASMQNIGQQSVRNLWVPFPPLPEQVAIAAYLDVETAKIDKLVAKVERAIERLQEYRTAIVTAAVTGKIDVRESAV